MWAFFMPGQKCLGGRGVAPNQLGLKLSKKEKENIFCVSNEHCLKSGGFSLKKKKSQLISSQRQGQQSLSVASTWRGTLEGRQCRCLITLKVMLIFIQTCQVEIFFLKYSFVMICFTSGTSNSQNWRLCHLNGSVLCSDQLFPKAACPPVFLGCPCNGWQTSHFPSWGEFCPTRIKV